MTCPRCGGLGVICIDDMCRGCGECIHGDGTCSECGGDGFVDDPEPEGCDVDDDDDDDENAFVTGRDE